jgi:ATP synthase protein I
MYMVTINPVQAPDSKFDIDESLPLTPEQIRAIKAANPVTSPWWVVVGQVLMGSLVIAVAGWGWGTVQAVSALWGAASVVLPSALFARGLTGQFARQNPGSAAMSFFVWEFVKIVVTVGVLWQAQRWVQELSWPAMLVAMVLTLKVYWLGLAVVRKPGLVRK